MFPYDAITISGITYTTGSTTLITAPFTILEYAMNGDSVVGAHLSCLGNKSDLLYRQSSYDGNPDGRLFPSMSVHFACPSADLVYYNNFVPTSGTNALARYTITYIPRIDTPSSGGGSSSGMSCGTTTTTQCYFDLQGNFALQFALYGSILMFLGVFVFIALYFKNR